MSSENELIEEKCFAAHQARTAAEFAGAFLMDSHRGVIDCGSYFIIYANDGYETDHRSRREANLVMEAVYNHDPVLGISDDRYTWAIVLADCERKKFVRELLNATVRSAWAVACEEFE